MAAEIKIVKTYGDSGSPTEVEVTTPGLLSSDDNALPSASPVLVPPSGKNYSYECWLRFKASVAPDNLCNNFKIWSSGSSVGTGLAITVNSDTVDTYVTPTSAESSEGTRVDFSTKDSYDKIDVDGDIINIGDKTDFSVFQLEAEPTATPGNKSYTVYYQYDES